MSAMDKNVELAQSQHVLTVRGVERLRYMGPHGFACQCGAISGQLHNIGCNREICPVCEFSMAYCECDHE